MKARLTMPYGEVEIEGPVPEIIELLKGWQPREREYRSGIEPRKEKDRDQLESILVPRFPFDKRQLTTHGTLEYLELENGRVFLRYNQSTVYTTREKLLALPENPTIALLISLGAPGAKATAIKAYLRYLGEKGREAENPAPEPQTKAGEGPAKIGIEHKTVQEFVSEQPKPMSEKTARLREIALKKGLT